MNRIRRTCLVVTLLGVVLRPEPGEAQVHSHPQPPWIEDVGIATANVAAGGVTAALTAWIRGEDWGRAFWTGALGGGITFLGKRIVVEDLEGAGLLGREVAALGSSVVLNAGEGRGWLDEVWLPVGPVWLQASPATPHRVRLDLLSAGTVAWAIGRSELRLDWKETLSSGAPVFRAVGHGLIKDGADVNGVAVGSVVLLGAGRYDADAVRSHELVHVVQDDFMLEAWSRPLEAWGWSRLLSVEPPVDLGLVPRLLLPPFLIDLREAEAEILEFR